MKMTSQIRRRPETELVHGGCVRSAHGETSEAIYLTQGFIYDSAERAEARFNGDDPGFVYSRYANPTVGMFEDRMRMLEGMEAGKATASGMAAVTSAIACHVSAGDHIVAARALFGSCRWVVEKLMPKFGVECTLVDGKDIDAWKEATRPNTTLYFLESPTNPTLELVDIQAVADLAHENDAILVVDNVFATPLYQRPGDFGADVVVYSATKHIDGQGRCLGGIILGSEEWVAEKLYDYYRHTGPSLSPFNAWNLLKGLETLPLRVERQTSTATKISEFLNAQKAVTKVIYPGCASHPQAELAARQMTGGSTLLAFEVDGGKAAAFELLNRLQLIMISNNLGDAKSLITHPSTTTHKNLPQEEQVLVGITDGLLRLSVGVEHADDLISDLEQALKS